MRDPCGAVLYGQEWSLRQHLRLKGIHRVAGGGRWKFSQVRMTSELNLNSLKVKERVETFQAVEPA